ncbi:Release factor glutamine methyltransferase [bacterium HR19]|nr:Release factor glutamine methyltransferase [bacterium HR19]
MRFRDIAIIISQLEGFSNPKIFMEQYETDGDMCAFLMEKAYYDIYRRYVVDLGCGTGFLSFASAMCEAQKVFGVDIDKKALAVAVENKKKLAYEFGLNLNVSFICTDVRYFYVKRRFDTCVMNPPFGIKNKGADRLFLKKAFEISDIVWTFLSANSEPFVKKFSEENGFEVSSVFKGKIQLRRKYFFHRKKVEFLDVDIYRIKRKEEKKL